jgi:hypothetical protein
VIPVYTRDCGQEIFQEMGERDITIPEIVTWIRTGGIGLLNTYLSTDFQMNSDSLELTPSMGEEEVAILKKIYALRYYEKKARYNLGATAYENTLSISSDGNVVRKLDRTMVAKTYLLLKADVEKELTKLITAYKINAATPRQVTGEDTCVMISSTRIRFNRIVVT